MASPKSKKKFLILYLVVAIVVAIVAILIVESMSWSNPICGEGSCPASCIATSGFYCQNAVFHNGVLSFRFGQATGANWTSTTLYFVPVGQNYSPKTQTYSEADGRNTQISNVSIAIPSSIASSAVGTPLQGTLYANYTTNVGANLTHFTIPFATLSVSAK